MRIKKVKHWSLKDCGLKSWSTGVVERWSSGR